MYGIIFLYGYAYNNGEKYLDSFYKFNLNTLESLEMTELLTGDGSYNDKKKEINSIVKMLKIRSRVQPALGPFYILSEVDISRDEFEMWIKTTSDSEIKERCKRL